jgi:hypothetical protein
MLDPESQKNLSAHIPFVGGIETAGQREIAVDLPLETAGYSGRAVGLRPHRDGHIGVILGSKDDTASPIDSREVDSGFPRRAQRRIPRAFVVSLV